MGKVKFMPCNIFPSRFLKFKLYGFKDLRFDFNDISFSECFRLCGIFLKEINKMYKKGFVFSEPFFSYSADEGSFTVEIGLMEIGKYKQLTSKKVKK